jgi:hypothetical protein
VREGLCVSRHSASPRQKLDHPRNHLDKQSQQQEAESRDEEPHHPIAPLSLSEKGNGERHKPQEQRNFDDH